MQVEQLQVQEQEIQVQIQYLVQLQVQVAEVVALKIILVHLIIHLERQEVQGVEHIQLQEIIQEHLFRHYQDLDQAIHHQFLHRKVITEELICIHYQEHLSMEVVAEVVLQQ